MTIQEERIICMRAQKECLLEDICLQISCTLQEAVRIAQPVHKAELIREGDHSSDTQLYE